MERWGGKRGEGEAFVYTSNELMFPHHAIPALRGARGPQFQALVERVSASSQCHEDTLAFMFMMMRLNGCAPCETDSFRAMRGCLPCAVQTLRRYKGSDEELIALFEQALREVRQFALLHPQYGVLGQEAAAARRSTA
jgi:hypothetical protein